jgi:4-hydroxy-tetrahydrodipicolinate reductase
MSVRVCVAGATGWTGRAVVRALLASERFELTGAVARQQAGADAGEAIGLPPAGVGISATLDEALQVPTDVLIDYTKPDSVKGRTLAALDRGVRVVVGTSGLTAADYAEIERAALARQLGVIAAGNFSITAALAKHFALIAARYLPSWEIIDYAHAEKVDAPSGTARELAEALGEIRKSELALPIEQTIGPKEARGATIAGGQIHSVRLPGYAIAFEALFGLPDERLSIRHEAGSGAEPYVAGTLLAAERTGRIGYGIEIEPRYVDVAVRRWQAMTGRAARHAQTGTAFDELATARCVAETKGD